MSPIPVAPSGRFRLGHQPLLVAVVAALLVVAAGLPVAGAMLPSDLAGGPDAPGPASGVGAGAGVLAGAGAAQQDENPVAAGTDATGQAAHELGAGAAEPPAAPTSAPERPIDPLVAPLPGRPEPSKLAAEATPAPPPRAENGREGGQDRHGEARREDQPESNQLVAATSKALDAAIVAATNAGTKEGAKAGDGPGPAVVTDLLDQQAAAALAARLVTKAAPPAQQAVRVYGQGASVAGSPPVQRQGRGGLVPAGSAPALISFSAIRDADTAFFSSPAPQLARLVGNLRGIPSALFWTSLEVFTGDYTVRECHAADGLVIECTTEGMDTGPLHGSGRYNGGGIILVDTTMSPRRYEHIRAHEVRHASQSAILGPVGELLTDVGTAVSWYENLPDRSHVDMAVKTLLNDDRSDNVYVRVAMATQVLNDRPYNSYQYCPLVQEMEAEDFQQADAIGFWTAYRPCVDLWDAVTIGGRRLFEIR